MLLLQVMNARRREQPGGAKGRGQQWDRQTFGNMAGAMSVPWGMAKGPCRPQTPRQDHGRKTWSFEGGVLPPAQQGAQQSWAGAECPLPPRDDTHAPSQPPSRTLVITPSQRCQGEGCRHPPPLSHGRWGPKQDPYGVLGIPSDHQCCLRGGCSDLFQSNPAKHNSARCQQRPAWKRDGAGCQLSMVLRESLGQGQPKGEMLLRALMFLPQPFLPHTQPCASVSPSGSAAGMGSSWRRQC